MTTFTNASTARFFTLRRAIEDHPTTMLIVLLSLVAVVRLVVGVLIFPTHPPRSTWIDISANLLSGGGYGYEPGVPTAYRGPVPIFLFAGVGYFFGITNWTVMVTNWISDVVTGYILFRIVLEVFPNRLYTAYTAIFLWAVYFPSALASLEPRSEAIFTLLLAAHMWTLLRFCRRPTLSIGAVSGVLLGLVVLTRPVVLLWVPVVWGVVVYAEYSRGSLRKLIDFRWVGATLFAFTIAFCLTLSPWVVRNYIVYDALIPTTVSLGWALSRENALLDKGVVPIADIHEPVNEKGESEYAVILNRYYEAHNVAVPKGPHGPKDQLFVDSKKKEFAFEMIRSYPVAYLKGCGYRFLRFWFNLGYGRTPSMQAFVLAIGHGTLMVLSMIAFAWSPGDWIRRSIPLVLLLAYFTFMHTLITAWVRYAIPVVPYLFVFSAFTLTQLAERFGLLGTNMAESGEA
jgi:hypothetical protein